MSIKRASRRFKHICEVCQPLDRPEFIVAGPHALDDHKEARAEMQAAITGKS